MDDGLHYRPSDEDFTRGAQINIENIFIDVLKKCVDGWDTVAQGLVKLALLWIDGAASALGTKTTSIYN